MTMDALAILGGTPVRQRPMPARRALGPAERAMIDECLAYYAEREIDPGYQDRFEQGHTDLFVSMMGGGYADAVASGTAALFVALAALDIPRGSQVLCSPITDPGTLSAIIMNGLVPRLIDSMPGSYNTGPEQFAARIVPEVKAAVVVHAAGQACDVEAIVATAHAHDIKVLEDCSQAHQARWKGQLVGTFGDIAAFSTMYRKASIAGGAGGLVYTRDQDLFHRALAHADRGKPVWQEGFDWRDPRQFLFPALNLHTDELSSAIGIASLGRLQETVLRRLAFIAEISGLLRTRSQVCRSAGYSPNDSPFICPIYLNLNRLSCSKMEFANALLAEGIPLNPHYQYVAATWPFLAPYLADTFDCPNARQSIETSFVLYVNENYAEEEARDIAAAVHKVEAYYLK
jgi:dTDP-4-amino-4,6-dideoxygalactose transaminase